MKHLLALAFLAGVTSALAQSPYSTVPGISVPEAVDAERIVGDYHDGDGLNGANLILFPDGTYRWEEYSDFAIIGGGDSPELRGEWLVKTNKVHLSPGPSWSELDVLIHNGRVILVSENDRDFFLMNGPGAFTRFEYTGRDEVNRWQKARDLEHYEATTPEFVKKWHQTRVVIADRFTKWRLNEILASFVSPMGLLLFLTVAVGGGAVIARKRRK